MRRHMFSVFLSAPFVFSTPEFLSAQDIVAECTIHDRDAGKCAVVMERKQLGLSSLLQGDGASVCYLSGLEAEQIVIGFYRRNQMSFQPQKYDNIEGLVFNLDHGACDLVAVDAREAVSIVERLSRPEDLVVLAEISYE